jgi:hypothetical protein
VFPGLALLLFGGFLLGGVWSVWNAEHPPAGRTSGQVGFAFVLLLAAVLASVGGVLWMVG